jgi:hypothetical protein
MICQRVLQVLTSIVKKTDADVLSDELLFLTEKGLVSLVSLDEYQLKSEDLKNLAIRRQELSHAKVLRTGFKKTTGDLQDGLDSGWHTFWSKKSTIAAEKVELEKCNQLMAENQAKIDQLEVEISRLEKLEGELEECIRLRDSYVALSENGNHLLPFLAAGISKAENRPYEEFEKAFLLMEAAIRSRCERFLEMYKYLRSNGFNSDSKVIQTALSLSGLDGTVEEVWEKAKVVNDFFYEHDWRSYDRLRIVSSVTSLPGDIHELRDKLEEIFRVMTQGGHSKCYATWSEAAALLKIPSGDAEEKYRRYEDMREALAKRGWRKGSSASCIIAANLSQRSGEPESIAEEFRTLEKKLVERGRNDSIESGIASLILMGMKGTLDERADRFVEVFQAMKARSWGSTDDYPAAAVLTLTPGTPEENVLRLAQTRKWLRDNGFSNDLNMRSATLVAGCFRDFAKQYLSSPAALESLRDSYEGAPDTSGDVLLAAAIVLMFGGDPFVAGLTAMGSGSMLLGVAAGMALSPADGLSPPGGEMEMPSFQVPDSDILQNLDLGVSADILSDVGVSLDGLTDFGASISMDSFGGDMGGGFFGD